MLGLLKRRASQLCRGDVVVVRSGQEILSTLDTDGKLDGLPFMPEMAAHCGRRYRVHRRVNKAFLDHHYYVARLDDVVLLEGVRCDGASHCGCQMGCLMLWKEAWLEPAGGDGAEMNTPAAAPADPVDLPAPAGHGRCRCQATEVVHAGSRLPGWDVRQYWRDLATGEATPGQLVRMFGRLVRNKFRRLCGRPPVGAIVGAAEKTSAGDLDLEPGEWVEVKSREEIAATLDADSRTRGLAFSPQMADFCGRRLRVVRRVERVVLEWSGELRTIRHTVALEGATCDGIPQRGCPRDCYHLWREAWLKRVDGPDE